MKESPLPLIKLFLGISTSAMLMTGCQQRGAHAQPTVSGTQVAAAPRAANNRPGSPIQYDRSKRYIFLTFDDAPQMPGTFNCQKVFADEGVKATFFMVGLHSDMSRQGHEMVDSIRKDYPRFLIANHSYSHAFRNHYQKFYSHPDSALKDFLRAETVLQVPVRIARLPGNNSWVGIGENKGSKGTMSIRYKLDSLGYNVLGWDVEWEQRLQHGVSSPRQTVDRMVGLVNYCLDNEKTNLPNAVVILAHDRMFAKPQYADSLAKFIAILKQDPRNVFETADHYPLVQRQMNAADLPVIAYASH